jgi:hypothetical protein
MEQKSLMETINSSKLNDCVIAVREELVVSSKVSVKDDTNADGCQRKF